MEARLPALAPHDIVKQGRAWETRASVSRYNTVSENDPGQRRKRRSPERLLAGRLRGNFPNPAFTVLEFLNKQAEMAELADALA